VIFIYPTCVRRCRKDFNLRIVLTYFENSLSRVISCHFFLSVAGATWLAVGQNDVKYDVNRICYEYWRACGYCALQSSACQSARWNAVSATLVTRQILITYGASRWTSFYSSYEDSLLRSAYRKVLSEHYQLVVSSKYPLLYENWMFQNWANQLHGAESLLRLS
jgi:hypothetical protein